MKIYFRCKLFAQTLKNGNTISMFQSNYRVHTIYRNMYILLCLASNVTHTHARKKRHKLRNEMGHKWRAANASIRAHAEIYEKSGPASVAAVSVSIMQGKENDWNQSMTASTKSGAKMRNLCMCECCDDLGFNGSMFDITSDNCVGPHPHYQRVCGYARMSASLYCEIMKSEMSTSTHTDTPAHSK